MDEYEVSGGDHMIKVWTLKSKKAPKKGLIPVMSLTHGGGALFGDANS